MILDFVYYNPRYRVTFVKKKKKEHMARTCRQPTSYKLFGDSHDRGDVFEERVTVALGLSSGYLVVERPCLVVLTVQYCPT